jgi:hypothetical protein
VLEALTPTTIPSTRASHPGGRQTTTALLNGQPVAVDQAHRPWSATDDTLGAPGTPKDESVVLTVSAPISLTMEDVVAVLFGWGLTYEDLAEGHMVRALIADTVINHGCSRIAELHARLSERPSLTEHDKAYLAYCRWRATTLFSIYPEIYQTLVLERS